MTVNQRDSAIKQNLCAHLCLLMLLASGCGTFQHHEPDWVRNPKTVYPENSFLVAIGEGDTRRAAENAADANLSRIFESHIDSDERVVDKVSESTTDFIRTTDLTTDINILSSQTLFNIQHAEAWKDDTGRYHAVAYLNRRDTATIYRDRIDEQSERVQSLLHYADVEDYPLRTYALLRAALGAAMENDLLLSQLKVIHPPSAAACAPSYRLVDIQKAAIESAKAIRVAISLDGDTEGRMTAALQEMVTNYGFVVGSPADLKIRGEVSITDTGQRTAGLAFFRYNLSVRITDDQGNVLVAINEKGREAVTSPEEARMRCFRTMENAIKTKGRNRMDTYFDSAATTR